MTKPPPETLTEVLDHARTLGRQGEVLEAGRFLRQMEAHFPESSELYYLLGACYLKVSRPDLALTALRKACFLAPGNQRARGLLMKLENQDATVFEISEDTSGAITGDLDSAWDPTH